MGVVDADENPLKLIDSAHFDEVQKYVNLTAHQYSFYTYSVSEAWFQTLPQDLQKVVLKPATRPVNITAVFRKKLKVV